MLVARRLCRVMRVEVVMNEDDDGTAIDALLNCDVNCDDFSRRILFGLPAFSPLVPVLRVAGLVAKHISSPPPPNNDAHSVRHGSHQPVRTPPERHTTLHAIHHQQKLRQRRRYVLHVAVVEICVQATEAVARVS